MKGNYLVWHPDMILFYCCHFFCLNNDGYTTWHEVYEVARLRCGLLASLGCYYSYQFRRCVIITGNGLVESSSNA